MGFGRHLRKRLKKAAGAVTKVAAPIHSKGAVKSVVHGVEKYGKTVGGAVLLAEGGLVGAAIVKKNPHFSGGQHKIAAKVEPVEKAVALVAGTALGVGGAVSAVTGAIGGSSAGSTVSNDGASSSGGGGGDLSAGPFPSGPSAAAASGGASPVIWIAAGGLVFVALLVAALRRRRRR